jgi:hypothetical protein
MAKLMYILLILSAVIAVAVADVFLKKAAVDASRSRALQSPWLVGAVLLYLYQILFFTYIFVTGGELCFVGTLQTAFYALIVVGAGVVIFRETLSSLQIAGVVLAIVSSVLINLK